MTIKPGTKWLVLVTGSLLLSLVVAEIILRAFDFSYYWSVSKRADPQVGWLPSPGSEGWQKLEGRAYVRINEIGYRGPDFSPEKPPGTLRIAVLGDSFTEAVQVPVGRTFWSVAEQSLGYCRDTPYRNVEVINFGVSGYSTAQQLLTLRHRVWAYRPDIILLAFFHGNDIAENYRILDNEASRPYMVLQDHQLSLDDSFTDSSDYQFRTSWYGRLGFAALEHSRLLQALDRSFDLFKLRRQKYQDLPPEYIEPGVDNHIYHTPSDPDWRSAWRVTEALLIEFNREASVHGAKLLLATLSTAAQTHPDPEVRRAYARAMGVPDLFYPERRIWKLGQQHGFLVLNLAPYLQHIASRYNLFLHGFPNSVFGLGHWNSEGHRLAGKRIAEMMCRDMLNGRYLYYPETY